MRQVDDRVALFAMCVVDQVMPEIGLAAARLLRRAGYAVDFPQAQTCCGQPWLNSGFRREAADLARHTIETFEDYPAVVIPSGSCAAMLRVEYAHFFEDEPAWGARAAALAAKTFELSEFLVRVARWQPSPSASGGNVTYHDSCHASRLIGLRDEPRQLLASAGFTIVEMVESDRCCGFGGLFSMRMPEVSNAMTAEKLRLAEASGAPTLVTVDPGCLMQMRGLVAGTGVRAEARFRAEHIATLVEEATR